jgi:Phosphoesterase family
MLMRAVSRRRFLQLAGGSVAGTMLSDSIARALAIPANRASRSIRDVEHIVVLTQENRSFDHYFGVMRGVRGFGDPHPATLPSGRPVWYQADGAAAVPPFRPAPPPGLPNLELAFIEDLDHNWNPTHQMFNGGNWDQWLPAKTTTCMARGGTLRPSVPLRAGRRVHGVRRLLLLFFDHLVSPYPNSACLPAIRQWRSTTSCSGAKRGRPAARTES